ncbi:hypothetical protein NLI96_g8696 [Meripilus lineatus]|uniref:DNA 3'-5' helicase n=1 Tax=Meripilus lineatus TaxID=2056292 RepID=A0AAD5YBS1_9APHY|nr:hypothetical protein NLI96_g8696 [Physisporinus lineatus]
MDSYRDLDFVLPKHAKTATDIPKTWIYVDNILTGGEIIDYLTKLIRDRFITTQGSTTNLVSSLDSRIVRPYNAVMSSEYRKAAMEAFREGEIRVMVCTEAAGMGCDIPDIDIVVQWKLPRTFSNWIQRAGRAARGRGRTGLAILLVERSAYSIDPSPSESQTSSHRSAATPKTSNTPATTTTLTKRKAAKKSLGKNIARPDIDSTAEDEGLLLFVQAVTCRRKIWAEVFSNDISKLSTLISDPRPSNVPCCDICDPKLFDRTRPSAMKNKKEKNIKYGQPVREVEQRLRKWRQDVYDRDHPTAIFHHGSILEDDLITALSSVGPMTQVLMKRLLSSKWLWWKRYGDELFTLLSSLEIPFVPRPSKSSKGTSQELSIIYAVFGDPLSNPKKRPNTAVGVSDLEPPPDPSPTSSRVPSRMASKRVRLQPPPHPVAHSNNLRQTRVPIVNPTPTSPNLSLLLPTQVLRVSHRQLRLRSYHTISESASPGLPFHLNARSRQPFLDWPTILIQYTTHLTILSVSQHFLGRLPFSRVIILPAP